MGDTRERVLKELVATESSYHHDLQVVVDGRVRASDTPTEIVHLLGF